MGVICITVHTDPGKAWKVIKFIVEIFQAEKSAK